MPAETGSLCNHYNEAGAPNVAKNSCRDSDVVDAGVRAAASADAVDAPAGARRLQRWSASAGEQDHWNGMLREREYSYQQ